MKKINDENIDEIMFGLLEGDITGLEREQLLEAIASDPAYAAMWKAWQNTVLQPSANEVLPDFDFLKKKKTFVLTAFIKYSAAAVIILSAGLFIYYNTGESEEFSGIIKEKSKPYSGSKIPSLPKDTSSFHGKHDSILPLREKVRFMAENKNAEEQVFQSDDLIQPKNEARFFSDRIQVPEPISQVNNDTPILADNTVDMTRLQGVAVTVENEYSDLTGNSGDTTNSKKGTFLSRLFGGPSIKIEKDKSTFTRKKIIIENKKYQIIAGF